MNSTVRKLVGNKNNREILAFRCKLINCCNFRASQYSVFFFVVFFSHFLGGVYISCQLRSWKLLIGRNKLFTDLQYRINVQFIFITHVYTRTRSHAWDFEKTHVPRIFLRINRQTVLAAIKNGTNCKFLSPIQNYYFHYCCIFIYTFVI